MGGGRGQERGRGCVPPLCCIKGADPASPEPIFHLPLLTEEEMSIQAKQGDLVTAVFQGLHKLGGGSAGGKPGFQDTPLNTCPPEWRDPVWSLPPRSPEEPHLLSCWPATPGIAKAMFEF